MIRRCATEVDFPDVLSLVAAHAKTSLGAQQVLDSNALPSLGEGVRSCRLTLELERLLAEEGPLTLAGIDEALPFLDPAAPPTHQAPDLLTLLSFARRVASVRRALLNLDAEQEILVDLCRRLPDTQPLVDWVAPKLGRDGTMPDSASPRLAALRRDLIRTRRQLLEQLEALRRRHASATADAPPTLRRDRYCLPVRAGARNEVRGLVLDASGSGATVFVEPFEIVEANNSLVQLAAQEREEVERILDEVATAFSAALPEMRRAANLLAELDSAQARALFGRTIEGTIVVPGEGKDLVLVGARHPLLDARLASLRHEILDEPADTVRAAVPLDLRLPEGVTTLVISGPNAGGKTVVLKTVGLMVLMAYRGIPLPAEPGTIIPEIRHLWCHIGDEQDVAQDLSTFSASMAATCDLLDHATSSSLVLCDELGAGTDPLEGAALGTAVLEELARRRATTVATTHLAAISQAVASQPDMDTAAMEYDEDADQPTYRLRIGRPGRSRGLEIARRMGLAGPVVERAADLLGGQHLEMERWLEKMERLEHELLEERRGLELGQIELARRQREIETVRDQLEAERKQNGVKLEAERARLRRTARERLDRALRQLEEAMANQERLGRRRREKLRQEALALELGESGEPARPDGDIEAGDTVRLRSLGSRGEVEAIRGSRIRVAVGGKRIWVERSDAERLEPEKSKRAQAGTIRVEVEAPSERELKLLGMDAEAAREEVERFLDLAFAADVPRVRIVHGHGTGTLKRVVTDVCKSHPAVHSFSHPPRHRGGSGVTEVELENTLNG